MATSPAGARRGWSALRPWPRCGVRLLRERGSRLHRRSQTRSPGPGHVGWAGAIARCARIQKARLGHQRAKISRMSSGTHAREAASDTSCRPVQRQILSGSRSARRRAGHESPAGDGRAGRRRCRCRCCTRRASPQTVIEALKSLRALVTAEMVFPPLAPCSAALARRTSRPAPVQRAISKKTSGDRSDEGAHEHTDSEEEVHASPTRDW